MDGRAPGELSWDELPGLFPGLGDPQRWLPLLREHARLVEAAAPAVRVSAVGGTEAIRRQYAESLELLRMALGAGADTSRVADVGSGGGFPGLVVAAVLPTARAWLIEPLQKRARFLREAAEAMGLANVEVLAERAEDVGRGILRESMQLVMARAVAPLAELLEYTAPLAAPGGTLALAKGSSYAEEVRSAAYASELLGCGEAQAAAMREVISETVSVVLYRKERATPPELPRRAGVPHRRPLSAK